MSKHERVKNERVLPSDERKEINDAFGLNLGSNPDRFFEIIQGTYRPPILPGEDPKITRSVTENPEFRSKTRKLADTDETEHRSLKPVGRSRDTDEDEMVEPVRRASSQNLSKFAQVLDRLERFPFSKDEDKLKKQMSVVEGAIRTAMYDLVLQEVANNTKKAFKDHVKRVVKIAGGLKVSFEFDSKVIPIVVKGSFFGDETICVHADDGSLGASVLKIVDDKNFTDLSDDYEIIMES